MKSVALYEYWFFGTCIRFLQDIHPGTAVHGKGMVLDVLDSAITRMEDLGLSVSLNTTALAKLDELLKELRESPDGARLSGEQAFLLTSQTNNLRLTLEAELLTVKAYVTLPKRIDTKNIFKNPSVLLAPSVFESLSEISQHDLTEAAKCILFERSTAAAFHLMRAVEDTLRGFYCHYVRRNRCSPMLWAAMVNELSRHRRAKKHVSLLRNLDNIRSSFRNPTQHPDKIYDIDEAQDLWALSVEVINRMHRAKSE